MTTDTFAAVPASLFDSAGVPSLGRFRGPLSNVDLSQRAQRQPLDPLRHKRWMYVAVATRELLCTAAIVDVGYAANAFAFVASTTGGMLAEVSALSIPRLFVTVGDRPEQGCAARFRAPSLRVNLQRPEGSPSYQLVVESAAMSMDVTLTTAGAPEPLSAVVDLAHLHGGLNVTTKRVLMPVSGQLRAGGRTVTLEGALGGFDYTQGFLPRHTVWKWAFLLGHAKDGTRVGVNLVAGFNGRAECVVWLNDELIPVDEGEFQHDHANPSAPWQVRTRCGTVDLTFTPFGVHYEYRNLLVVRSRFLQVMGSFSGRIRSNEAGRDVELDGVLGVTEDQEMVW
jgi:hypothetical protein